MKSAILISLLFFITNIYAKNVQDVKNITETQAYKMIENSGGILKTIKEITNGSNKTIANNNGRVQIDNTAFITAYQVKKYTQITKIVLLKSEYTTKFAKDNKISGVQAEKFLKREDIRTEILGQMKAVSINNYCPLTIFKVLFKEKLIMELIYHYDDGELFGSYTIDYDDCISSNTSHKYTGKPKKNEKPYSSDEMLKKNNLKGKYPEPIEGLIISCGEGKSESCVNLGVFFENGIGVKQSYLKAKGFYELACDDGYADGCKNYVALDKEGH